MNTATDQFCVRWNNRLKVFEAALPQLLTSERFVDVTLVCEGHRLHCHRLVLAASSKYFENVLAENPCDHPIVILPLDIKLLEIQAIINFIYQGEVNVSQAGLPKLLKCAEILQIRELIGLNVGHILNASLESSTLVSSQPSDASEGARQNLSPSVNQIQPPSVFVLLRPTVSAQSIKTNDNVSYETDNVSSMARTTKTVTQTATVNTSSTNPNTSKARTVQQNATSLSSEVGMENHEDKSKPNDKPVKRQTKTELPLPDVLGVRDHDQEQLPAKRLRRSENLLQHAAECIIRGQTFQAVSEKYNIPVSTLRFFMVRKGMLLERKRGRTRGTTYAPVGLVPPSASLSLQKHIDSIINDTSNKKTSLVMNRGEHTFTLSSRPSQPPAPPKVP